MRRIHSTMRGKAIDMDAIRMSNSSMKAVGNASLNANGDKIDVHGNIVKKREEMVRDYHKLSASSTVKSTNIQNSKMISDDGIQTMPSIDPNFYRRKTINDFEGITFATPEEVFAETQRLVAEERTSGEPKAAKSKKLVEKDE